MSKQVVIDHLPESAAHYKQDHAVIVVDVIRASTTATTAVSLGREVYPAQTTDEAFILAENLVDPIFAGELGGNVPYGFDLTNSPVQIAALTQIPSGYFTEDHRPIVLVSSSGTRLLVNAIGAPGLYVGCFRNFSAVAAYVAEKHDKVAVLGAGTRGEFRREDQIGCSWIAGKLMEHGFAAADQKTSDIVDRWANVELASLRNGRSAEYLKRSGQVHDLEFVLHHIDDLDIVPAWQDGKLVPVAGHPVS